jgi:predicted dehydrogenase
MTPLSSPIATGVIGYGLGGSVFHAPFISAVPTLRLDAIVQRSGNQAATAWPGTRILRSVEELLADTAIKLVVVSTPNPTHFAMARQALQAGKNVVIDKPFTTTSAQARELIDLAKAKELTLIPFHNRRWDGDFLTLRQLLAEQRLGRLVTFDSHFDRFRPIPRENTWKEVGDPSNGMLFDLGPHLLDQALFLFGMPDSLMADIRKDRDQTDIEDAFDITLYYPKLRAHISASYLACDASPRFLLHGTHGSFRKFGLDPQEPACVAGQRPPKLPGTENDWLAEPEKNWGTLTIAPDPAHPANLITQPVPTVRGDYRNFYVNVADVLLGRAQPAITSEDGYNVIRLLELARESSRVRQAVSCRL